MTVMLTRRTAANGLETWMELTSKKLLRRAMTASADRAAQGLGPDCSSLPKLAVATGLSVALVGFLVTEGKTSRTTCTVDSARRIADALGWDYDELFTERTHGNAA